MQELINKKLEEYRKDVKSSEEVYLEKKTKLVGSITGEMQKKLASAAREGRLDIATGYYVAKSEVEKGNSDIKEIESLPEQDRRELLNYAKLIQSEEKTIINQINELNNSLYQHSIGLIARAQSLTGDRKLLPHEWDRITMFASQFPLPSGAVLPEGGERVGGLNCTLYDGTFNQSSNIESSGIVKKKFLSGSISIPWGSPQVMFGLVWDGLFYAEKEGEYVFSLESDDSSLLQIGEEVLIYHGGAGVHQGSSTMYLERGWHPIKVNYAQVNGDKSISLKVLVPGEEESREIRAKSLAASYSGPSFNIIRRL